MNSPVNCLLNGGDKGPKKFSYAPGLREIHGPNSWDNSASELK